MQNCQVFAWSIISLYKVETYIEGKFGYDYIYLIKNSQAVKKGAAPKKAMVKKDVKSKVAAKKWL